MGEKIKQSDPIGRVQLPNRARDAGPRKQPRKPPDRAPAKDHGAGHDNDSSHRVDEYA